MGFRVRGAAPRQPPVTQHLDAESVEAAGGEDEGQIGEQHAGQHHPLLVRSA